MCKGLTWKLQGTEFTADVLLLPLCNCDMVLGIQLQWLETLGDFRWNFVARPEPKAEELITDR